MAEKTALKAMRCPTCGGSLKAKNNTEAIVCVYCGNTIIPVNDTAAADHEGGAGALGGVVRVEGIKTSSSALAYIELFFEEYDWTAFTYDRSLTVREIDKLTASLKSSSADDKSTWLACFKAISVPFVKKAIGCKQLALSAIAKYKKGDLDAYSDFDAYRCAATLISASKNSTIEKLQKNSAYAAKYGASADELGKLNSEIDNIRSINIPVYTEFESIPEIVMFMNEKNARIASQLAASGINASAEYARAKTLIEEEKYVDALNLLSSLKGYSDSDLLIEKIDKYYLISDVLEIEGKLYYFKKAENGSDLNLLPTKDGKIISKPLISGIKQIVTNYADILYYVDSSNHLKKFSLSHKKEEKICKKTVSEKNIYVYGNKAFLLARSGTEGTNVKKDIVELDLATALVDPFIENVLSITSLTGNKMIYTVAKKSKKSTTEAPKSETVVVNVETMETVSLGTKKLEIKGFIGDLIVYTTEAPNKYNKHLFVKSFNPEEPAFLVEENILDFAKIIAGKLFYYIGNTRNKTLIYINPDGTERKEWALYVHKLLFEEAGWIYYIRKAGYTAILCKAHTDGSNYTVIARNIDEFVAIKNGFLYYINDDSSLMKVRMDGSNLKELCDDVEKVLAVAENKIIFVSIDDKIRVGQIEQLSTVKIIKSIYAVDFTGSGKIKLVYDVKSADEFDENYVYYIVKETTKNKNQNNKNEENVEKKVLYKLDVKTNAAQRLLELKIEKKGCYVATCVYGSYDCPEVWTLRRYRDDTLGSTWYGRLFIKLYYAVSPTLVKWFGHTSWFKRMWRGKLDRMVQKLNNKGVENTPYKDKEW